MVKVPIGNFGPLFSNSSLAHVSMSLKRMPSKKQEVSFKTLLSATLQKKAITIIISKRYFLMKTDVIVFYLGKKMGFFLEEFKIIFPQDYYY